MGVLVDLDLLITVFFKKPLGSHHLIITHTPLFGLVFSILALVFFNLPIIVVALGYLSFLLHLLLDGLPYILYKLNLLRDRKVPYLSYISWHYPFDKEKKSVAVRIMTESRTASQLITCYIRGYPYMVAIEIVSVLLAVFAIISGI